MNKVPFYFSLIIFAQISCNPSKENHFNGENNIKLFYREKSDDDGYYTYNDMLLVTNYRNKSMSIKQLYEIAKKDVDTAKTRYPVVFVSFFGQRPGEPLPELSDTSNKEHKSTGIILFEFDNAFKEFAGKKNHEIIWLSILGDKDKHKSYYKIYHAIGSKEYDEDKRQIDSLINSDKPLDTGF